MSNTKIKVKELQKSDLKPMSMNRHGRRSLAKRMGTGKIAPAFKPKVNKKK